MNLDNRMTVRKEYDFAMTVGFPESRMTFWGEEEQRREQIFRACTEMSDTKFVTTRAKQRCGGTPGRYSEGCNFKDRKTTFGDNGKRNTEITVATMSYTVTSRETVLKVSAQIDSGCRLFFRDTLIPVKNSEEGLML